MEAGPRNTAHGESERLSADGPGTTPDEAVPDGSAEPGPDEDEPTSDSDVSEVEVELRPQRRLRIWQIAPIVALAAIGSLMFAFPLAFEFGDGGAVVAMLGILLSCCSAGWGVMAARRVGLAWPGLPVQGSGRRPDWRVIAVYTVVVLAVAVLAVWRVDRLR
ncbi:hypothetical protein DSC45_30770 [Streptomyces sp. YIM 130001]|uniref:hypothetical protein n=1 Tax=Streptomyces sp. YIM 130001 TaxID=2259644 RepID=UPI000ECA9872|nr:hypothetical protein DSC45_30770 [Streptomyces sp. YIM 130001]